MHEESVCEESTWKRPSSVNVVGQAPKKKYKYKLCPCGRQKANCKTCGGVSICPHGRLKHRECGGSNLCTHEKLKDYCIECGGTQICECGIRRAYCEKCAKRCTHGNFRSTAQNANP